MDSKKILITESLLNSMVFHGASSASLIVYENDKMITHVTTCDKWQDFYLNATKYTSKCHIKEHGMFIKKQSNFFSIVWDSIVPTNDESLYLNEERERHEHCHGISICQIIDNKLIGLVLTGKRNEHDFALKVIRNKRLVEHPFKQLKNIHIST